MKALTKRSFHRMLQLLTVSLLGAMLAVTTSSCGRKTEEEPHTHAHPEAATYTCPMHPEVTQASPGDCPSCGMRLTLAPASPEHEHSNGTGSSDRAHADHDPKHGGMLGMQGDRHVELVASHGGDLEVHLYDEYTKPLAAPGARARVDLELTGDAALPVSVRLEQQSAPGTWRGHSKLADRAVAAIVTPTGVWRSSVDARFR